MLSKLAFRNVRRSVRDYAIYFVTLVFGVAVFYAFNSVQSQSILFDLEGASTESIFNLTGQFLGMFSVLIAFVLGFLVVYSNRFLIKRRKQEFGTYLLLGMRPGQVSAIVLMETIAVGAVSLVVGLALGVALSQGLSFFTAGLFNIPMQQYRFVFSSEAFVQTLACFTIIFVVVAAFNTLSIRRYKLIDLLSAKSRNEGFRVRSPWVSLVGFIASVALLAAAYKTLVDFGMMEFGREFFLATALMLVGTFLFFWSAAGFALIVVERTRGVYFKGLAMFTMRQIASKVNTAFLSLSVVCVMLFFSLTVFSTGTGLVSVFTGDIERSTQFDATLTANVYLGHGDLAQDRLEKMRVEDPEEAEAYLQREKERAQQLRAEGESWNWDIAARISADAPWWNDFVKESVQADLYQPTEGTTTYGEFMDRYQVGSGNSLQDSSMRTQPLLIVGESQFNAVRTLTGQDPVSVGEDGYAVSNAVSAIEDLARAIAEKGRQVNVAGRTLTATGAYAEQVLATSPFVNDAGIVVVPDSVIAEARAAGTMPYMSYLDVNYSVDAAQGDKMLEEALDQAFPPDDQQESAGWSYGSRPWPVTVTMTKAEVIEQAGGMNVLITYLALYIGFTFLITTAAMLAIQQLSETSDSLPRYKVLAQIGCDRRMILGSLRTQVLVYFLAPLGLAVCHAACAVSVIGSSVFDLLGVSVSGPILMTGALTVLVYGSYLAVTYFTCRGVIKSSLGSKLLG